MKTRMLSFAYVCAIMGFLTVTSCTTSKPTPIAYDCPRILLPADPVIPIRKLTDKSKPDDVIKAWVATAVAYRDWNRVVRKQVNNL